MVDDVKYDNFSLITKVVGVCRECDSNLIEIGKTLFCPKCESVYALRLVKIPDKYVTGEWIIQAKKLVSSNNKK